MKITLDDIQTNQLSVNIHTYTKDLFFNLRNRIDTIIIIINNK